MLTRSIRQLFLRLSKQEEKEVILLAYSGAVAEDIEKKVTADDDYTFERDGNYYVVGNKIQEGRIREVPCPPNMEKAYRNQFESWQKI